MSDSIKPSDLCIVVRDCCGHWLGAMVTVGGIGRMPSLRCGHCPYVVPCVEPITLNAMGGRMILAPVAWLRRIPPLAELEGAERRVEVTA